MVRIRLFVDYGLEVPPKRFAECRACQYIINFRKKTISWRLNHLARVIKAEYTEISCANENGILSIDVSMVKIASDKLLDILENMLEG